MIYHNVGCFGCAVVQPWLAVFFTMEKDQVGTKQTDKLTKLT